MEKWATVVPNDETLRNKTIESRHNAELVGHRGITKTLQLVGRGYYWKNMKISFRRFVESWNTCGQTELVL